MCYISQAPGGDRRAHLKAPCAVPGADSIPKLLIYKTGYDPNSQSAPPWPTRENALRSVSCESRRFTSYLTITNPVPNRNPEWAVTREGGFGRRFFAPGKADNSDKEEILLYRVGMSDEFWAKLDAYLFKFLGLILGAGGLLGLLLNNPLDTALHNTYGVTLVVVFAIMGGYSLYSLIVETIRKPE